MEVPDGDRKLPQPLSSLEDHRQEVIWDSVSTTLLRLTREGPPLLPLRSAGCQPRIERERATFTRPLGRTYSKKGNRNVTR